MSEVIREGAVRVGVDLAKRVIQAHAVDCGERVLTSRALARDKFLAWCTRLPAGCVVAMEASSSAHHRARKLLALGLQPRIISGQLVSPYRQEGNTGKNDANDAAAICEAASRPRMRFIPVKSVEQQSMLRMAEGDGGLGEQERAHPVGRDDPRRHVRRRPPELQARRRCGFRRSRHGAHGVGLSTPSNQLPCTT